MGQKAPRRRNKTPSRVTRADALVEIIDQLALERIRQGFLQKDIAKEIGCSNNVICELERYQLEHPKIEILEKYANILGLTIKIYLRKK